jgi:hypothetical protein
VDSDRNANGFFADGAAGLASCDSEFKLVAVVNRRGDRWSLSTANLSGYFIPKSRTVPREPVELASHIRELGKGIGYTNTASDYVFAKVCEVSRTLPIPEGRIQPRVVPNDRPGSRLTGSPSHRRGSPLHGPDCD